MLLNRDGFMNFTKMHGLGNDFIILHLKENEEAKLEGIKKNIKLYCDRHFGIGADGVLILTKTPKADIFMHIFNADGSQAEQCGNALRCVAKFLYEKLNIKKEILYIETIKGINEVFLHKKEAGLSLVVNMGKPTLFFLRKEFVLAENVFYITSVSMGNPHAIVEVTDFTDILVTYQNLREDENFLQFFPTGVNIEFANFLSKKKAFFRVFERGVGETLSCGSGACAVFFTGYIAEKLENKAQISSLGGSLYVFKKGENLFLEGDAFFVYEGMF